MARFFSKTTGGFYDDELHETMPPDALEVSDEVYAALFAAQAAGKMIKAGDGGAPVAVALPGPTPAQASAALARAVSEHIDQTAQAMGYDNILAAISYADESAVPAFQAQGQALRAWRSRVWQAANPTLDGVAAGTLVAPAAAALIATLPAFVAPAV